MAKATKKTAAAPVGAETAEAIRAEREAINERIEADKARVRELSERLRQVEGPIKPKTMAGATMTIKPAG